MRDISTLATGKHLGEDNALFEGLAQESMAYDIAILKVVLKLIPQLAAMANERLEFLQAQNDENNLMLQGPSER